MLRNRRKIVMTLSLAERVYGQSQLLGLIHLKSTLIGSQIDSNEHLCP